MHRKKKTKAGKPYFLIFIIIIAAAIGIIGYVIMTKDSGSETSQEYLSFEAKLKSDIEAVTQSETNSMNYELPSRYTGIVLVSDPESVRNPNHPFNTKSNSVIIDFINSGHNAFLVSDSGEVKPLNLPVFILESNYGIASFPIESGKLQLRIKGTSSGVLIASSASVVNSQIECAVAQKKCMSPDSGLVAEITGGSSVDVFKIMIPGPDGVPDDVFPKGYDLGRSIIYRFEPEEALFSPPLKVRMAYSPPFPRASNPLVYSYHSGSLEQLTYKKIDDYTLSFDLQSLGYIFAVHNLDSIRLELEDAKDCSVTLLWEHGLSNEMDFLVFSKEINALGSDDVVVEPCIDEESSSRFMNCIIMQNPGWKSIGSVYLNTANIGQQGGMILSMAATEYLKLPHSHDSNGVFYYKIIGVVERAVNSREKIFSATSLTKTVEITGCGKQAAACALHGENPKSGECCDGLERIQNSMPEPENPGICVATENDICLQCGDGRCAEHENACNCAADCI